MTDSFTSLACRATRKPEMWMNASTLSATGITTKIVLLPNKQQAFATWQSTFTRAATVASGFVSLEIIPACLGSAEWHVIQRFRSPELLDRWRTSAERVRLLEELERLQEPGFVKTRDEAAPDFHALSYVTEVITTVVEPGKDAAFQAWAEGTQAKQASFPGYMGTLVQAPLSAAVPYWTTLIRFSTPQQLDAWLASPDRQALLKTSDPLVSSWKSQRMASPFSDWFPGKPDQPRTAAWKQTALVLLVLFPVVMLEIKFLSPFLAGQHLAIATFIGNAISVSLVSWPLMAMAIFCLGWWLRPDPVHPLRTEVLGIGTMLGLYAIELSTFILLY